MAEQYLGSYLLQQSQRNDLLLPLMNALALANYDVIGVFAVMITADIESLPNTLIERRARLLARWHQTLLHFDHVPEEVDYAHRTSDHCRGRY